MKISVEDKKILRKIYKEEIEDKDEFPLEYFDMFGLQDEIHISGTLDHRHHSIMDSIDGTSIPRNFIDLKTGYSVPHLFWESTKDKTISPYRTCYFNKIWSYVKDYQLNDPKVIKFVNKNKMKKKDEFP